MLHFNLLLNRVGCCILISDEFFPRLMSGYNEEDIILSTAYFYAALAAGIAAVLVFLVLRVKYGGLKGLYSKAIASFFFLLTALSAAAVNPGHEVYAGLIVFGLVLGLSGDIWLDLKWIYEKDMEKFLNAGFMAFMIGHVFYIGAIYKFAGNWSVLTPADNNLGRCRHRQCYRQRKAAQAQVRQVQNDSRRLYLFPVHDLCRQRGRDAQQFLCKAVDSHGGRRNTVHPLGCGAVEYVFQRGRKHEAKCRHKPHSLLCGAVYNSVVGTFYKIIRKNA